MRKYYLVVTICTIIYILALAVFVVFTGKANTAISDSNVIKLNEITKDAQENWDNLSAMAQKSYGTDFVVINNDDAVLYASDPSGKLSSDMSIDNAFKNKLAYAYVVNNGQVKGCVIIPDTGQGGYSMIRIRLITGLAIAGGVLLICALIYGAYIKRSFTGPFAQMKDFAHNVSQGNFEKPPIIEEAGAFRDFLRSFELLNDELSRSREREIDLQEKECELLASLCHDLKTPVGGIKLITEMLQTKIRTVGDIQNDKDYILDMLDKIYNRADEVDTHVGTLLSSAMEDLGEFKVSCSDVESRIIGDMVKKADEKGLANVSSIPFVLIHIDTKRMRQVIGNIIDNCYKYAKTQIDVSFLLTDDYLRMNIEDHGPGVSPDEIGLITNRFYRGRRWAGSEEEGSGLGLFLAQKLMENMGGQLLVENTATGFCVTLLIKLS